jgi:hypothetical protein
MRALFLGFVVVVLSGCGGNKQCEFCEDDSGPVPGDETSLEDVSLNNDGGTPGEAGNCKQCSSDLHEVLDCNGNVLMTCPPDKGCAPDGTCVAACDAAKQNKSSVGCEYYAQNPPFFSGGSCFAAFIANTWGAPVKVTVDRGGQNFNVSTFGYLSQGSGQTITYTPITNGQIPAGQVGLLMLNKDSGLGCPNGLATATTGASFVGTGKAQAFHITTDAPVVAYDIYPFGGGSTAVASGTLLLPTSVWTDNYVGITAYPPGFGSGSWISVVGMQDNTQFTIVAPVAITGGGGVNGAAANTPTKYTVNKGEIIQFQQATDLSGSPIAATNPIGVWGGNHCTNLEQPACDGMHQQIPPVTALGSEYAAVRYRDRLSTFAEKPPWRIMGVVDGTTLTYDPGSVTSGPKTLKRGEVVEFDEGTAFVVKSQDDKHPFYFGAHMTGCFSLPGNYGSPIGCAGDPEFVNVVAGKQYLGEYVFFTDPTYPETHLVFVRAKAKDNTFKDVKLDCLGAPLTGWKNVDNAGNYQFTRIDVVTGNFTKVNGCDNGRHEAKSDGPFGLTVWGWGTNKSTNFFSEACSYAYAAGMSVQPINTVVVPPTPN